MTILDVIATVTYVGGLVFLGCSFAGKKISGIGLSKRGSWKEAVPSRYTLHHEVGHVMLNAVFKVLDERVMVCALGSKDEEGNLGYAVMTDVSCFMETRLLSEWEMLGCLAGYMSERVLLGEESLGANEDREQWMKIAKFYLESGFCDGVYYNKPDNQFEFKSNEEHLKALRERQEKLLTAFFEENKDVVSSAVDELKEKGVLDKDQLAGYFENVVFPDGFPIPVLE